MGQEVACLVPTEHDRDKHRSLGAYQVAPPFESATKHLLKQKQQRGQGLVLGPSADLGLAGKVGEKAADVGLGHGFRMALAVKQDEPANPRDVCLFGTRAVVPGAQPGAHAVEQARRPGRILASMAGFRPYERNDRGTVAEISVVGIHRPMTLRRPCRNQSVRVLTKAVGA